MVSVDEVVPPADNCKRVGCKVATGLVPFTTGKTLVNKAMLPEKPAILVRVIVEVPFLPAWIVSELGFAVMEKSGVGGGNTSRTVALILFAGMLSIPDGLPGEERTVTFAVRV